MTERPTIDPADMAKVLTTLHDIRAGYADRDLCDGWREAADRLADALGRDDPRDWPTLAEGETADD